MIKNISLLIIPVLSLYIFCPGYGFSQTEILKWQDGKDGCVTLTYDDGSINQFRIALPLMNERGLLAVKPLSQLRIIFSKLTFVFSLS